MLDSGNFSDNPTPVGDAKTVTLIDAMGRLGYDAANVGERDLKGGYDTLAERSAGAEFPLLSANIVRGDTGEPVFTPYTLIEAASTAGTDGVPVRLIGVARFNPLFRREGPEGSELEIVHPLEPVRLGVAALREQGAKLIILLAAMHRDDARRLLAEVEGLDFVVGSYGGIVTTSRNQESGTWVLYAGNQGKRLGESRLSFAPDGTLKPPQNKLHYLTPGYPADQEMLDYLNSAAAEKAGAPAGAQAGAPPSDLVGSTTCRRCHAAEYAQWASTPHATAFATLEREGNHGKAACLTCHTTSPGEPGGFVSYRETPQMAQVGCESCHGAGRAHVQAPRVAYGKIELRACTGCHDSENSPEFDYYSYREKVAHQARAAR